MSTHQDGKKTRAFSYRDAGVDIEAGNELVRRIAPLARTTGRPEVLTGLGGFGALFELPVDRYRHPVLVSSTDGVGTKLALAMQLGHHQTIGIDLVAMCVNDIVVTGAEPLFFLDYYATGRLDVDIATTVVAGIAEGCRQSGAALVGGETAEMPGMYEGSNYDLAGFCVGVVERERLIDGSTVAEGDVLIGLASSGPHSNGFSLIRKVLQTDDVDTHLDFAGSSLREVLMTPTRIYVRSVLALAAQLPVKAVCHVTGGGIVDNLPRVLPAGIRASISVGAWRRPPIFEWLQERGGITDDEMYRTFNCGIGMILCVAAQDVNRTVDVLQAEGETAIVIGTVQNTPGSSAVDLLA